MQYTWGMRIIGYDETEIPVQIVSGGSETVVVLYPGMGYSLQAPVFHYLGQLLLRENIDSIGINYRYGENRGYRQSDGNRRRDWIASDAAAIARTLGPVLAGYRKVLYVGKSLGTVVLRHQLDARLVRDDAFLVWLAPVDGIRQAWAYARSLGQKSLFLFGTGDPGCTPDCPGSLGGTDRLEIVEIPGAGHYFEAAGDIPRSIENLSLVMKNLERFILNSVSG